MKFQEIRSDRHKLALSLSKYSSLVTILIGCIVIVGWVFKIEFLTSIFPGIPPMRVNAALGFILSGGSLWFWHEYNGETNSDRPGRRSHQHGIALLLSCGLAIILSCIALLVLIQFVFSINLGVDELLIKDFTERIGYKYSGRIAMTAAIKFLMLSAALILLNRRIYSLAQGFAFASFLISLFGLCGYIYQVRDFYTLFSGGSIALAAVITFCILSLGILLARPEQGWLKVITSPYTGGITARYLLPFVIGLPLLLGGYLILSHRHNLIPIEVSILYQSIIDILILSTVTWWNARFLNNLDLKQRQTEIALRQSYEQLENRVAERTAELTNANHSFQESYQLLHSIIEGISDSLFVKDRSGRYVLVNSAMSRKLGKSKEEILGANDRDLFAPEIAEKLRETDRQIMESGETQEIEEEISENETEKTFLSTKSPWRDQDGNVIGLVGVIKDISDRKEIEINLQENEARFRIAAQSSSDLIYEWDTIAGTMQWFGNVDSLLGYEPGEFPRSLKGWETNIHPDDRTSVNSKIEECLQTGVAFDGEYRIADRNGEYRIWLDRGRVILDAEGRPGKWYGAITDITEQQAALRERNHAEAALQASEEQLRLTLEFAEIGSWAWNILENRLTWNRKLFQLLGLDPNTAEANYETWCDRIYPEDLARVETAIYHAIESHTDYDTEHRVIYPDGSIHWIAAKGRAVYDRSGQPMRMLGVIFDISERKQAEAALQASEEQLRLTLEFTQIGSWDWHLVENRITWNNNHFRLMGLDPNTTEANYQTWRDRVHRDDIEQVEAAINQALENHTDYETEYRVIHPDGSIHWIIAKGRAIYDRSGQPVRMLGVIIDITDRKQAEAALRRSEERWQLAVAGSQDGIWDSNLETFELYVSPRCLEMTGYTYTEASYQQWMSYIHPDDYPGLIAVFQEHLDRELEHYSCEHRLRCKDGSYKWFLVRGQAYWDETGKPLGAAGSLTDISDRKQAEIALRESEERFRRAIVDAPLPIILHADDGLILQVNHAWTEITGYSPEDIPTIADWIEKAYGSRKELVQANIQSLHHLDSRVYEGEYTIRTRAGETRIWDFYSAPLGKLPDGRSLVISTAIDITERKQAETALLASEKRLHSVLENMPVMLDAFDAEGNIIVWNQECERVTGYSAEEIMQDTQAWEIVYPDPVYRQKMMSQWKEIGHNYRNWEWDLVSKNGEIKTIAWSNISEFFPVPGWAAWGVGIDITERKQAELRVIQLNQSLEERVKERTAELAAANKELEAFSYSVSHDLRAPLRGIDGFSKVLLERYANQLDDQGKHYIDRIRAGTQRMGELIEDMLMLSRVTRAEIKRVPVNLSQIAQEVIKDLTESQPERSVQWDIAPEVMGLGDATLLRIVLENLLSNAWKFTSNCIETHIEFGTTIISGNIPAYFIKDNGVGFDMNYVNKLFIAFQRLHSIHDFPGTGVGLAIVQRIIHRHGGEVRAEGIINQGATFYFTLKYK